MTGRAAPMGEMPWAPPRGKGKKRMKLTTFDAFKHLKPDGAVTLNDAQLRALQQALLQITDDIVAVCNDNGLAYTLGGGSVLGAVRHHGFVPWDDDVDIIMPRADYERFVPLFSARFGDKYWVHTPQHTHNYALLMAKVRRKGTSVKTRDDFWNGECGAFVDVFILENTFDNALLRALHGAGAMALGLALSCRKFYRDRRFLLPMARGDRALGRVFRLKAALGFLVAWGSIDFWTHLADRWDALCRNGASRYITVPGGRNRFFGELYLRQDMCRTVQMDFEGRSLAVPAEYGKYLAHMYGDWHSPPPPQEREEHIFLSPFRLG